MALDRLLNLLATLFGGLGSVYVLRSVLAMTPDVMERLSRSYWDFSVPQVEALSSQKADGIVGTTLVLIAFVMAFVSIAFVPDGVIVFRRRAVGLGLALVLTVVAGLILVSVGTGLQRHQKHEIGRLMIGQEVDRVTKASLLTADDLSLLRSQAKTLLDWTIDEQEPAPELFARLAEVSGRKVPSQIDYSRVTKGK